MRFCSNTRTSTSVEELKAGVKPFVRLVWPYAQLRVRIAFSGQKYWVCATDLRVRRRYVVPKRVLEIRHGRT